MPPQTKRRGKQTYLSQSFLGKVIEKTDATGRKRRAIEMNYIAAYHNFLETICRLGDIVGITITNRKAKRTDLQNNYLHLYLHLISLSSGHTVKDLKIWVKQEFLFTGITEIFGDKVRKVKSTTELTIGEFLELIMRIEERTEIPAPDTRPFLLPMTLAEYKAKKKQQHDLYKNMKAKID